MKSNIVLALLTFGIAVSALADDGGAAASNTTAKLPPVSSQKDVTYEKDIKPIFDHSCIKCHGADRPKGKLRLDSLQGILKGGVDGKVVEAGKSANSMLVENVAHMGDPEDWMPPTKNRMGLKPLAAEQISLIRAWIDQGVK